MNIVKPFKSKKHSINTIDGSNGENIALKYGIGSMNAYIPLVYTKNSANTIEQNINYYVNVNFEVDNGRNLAYGNRFVKNILKNHGSQLIKINFTDITKNIESIPLNLPFDEENIPKISNESNISEEKSENIKYNIAQRAKDIRRGHNKNIRLKQTIHNITHLYDFKYPNLYEFGVDTYYINSGINTEDSLSSVSKYSLGSLLKYKSKLYKNISRKYLTMQRHITTLSLQNDVETKERVTVTLLDYIQNHADIVGRKSSGVYHENGYDYDLIANNNVAQKTTNIILRSLVMKNITNNKVSIFKQKFHDNIIKQYDENLTNISLDGYLNVYNRMGMPLSYKKNYTRLGFEEDKFETKIQRNISRHNNLSISTFDKISDYLNSTFLYENRNAVANVSKNSIKQLYAMANISYLKLIINRESNFAKKKEEFNYDEYSTEYIQKLKTFIKWQKGQNFLKTNGQSETNKFNTNNAIEAINIIDRFKIIGTIKKIDAIDIFNIFRRLKRINKIIKIDKISRTSRNNLINSVDSVSWINTINLINKASKYSISKVYKSTIVKPHDNFNTDAVVKSSGYIQLWSNGYNVIRDNRILKYKGYSNLHNINDMKYANYLSRGTNINTDAKNGIINVDNISKYIEHIYIRSAVQNRRENKEKQSKNIWKLVLKNMLLVINKNLKMNKEISANFDFIANIIYKDSSQNFDDSFKNMYNKTAGYYRQNNVHITFNHLKIAISEAINRFAVINTVNNKSNAGLRNTDKNMIFAQDYLSKFVLNYTKEKHVWNKHENKDIYGLNYRDLANYFKNNNNIEISKYADGNARSSDDEHRHGNIQIYNTDDFNKIISNYIKFEKQHNDINSMRRIYAVDKFVNYVKSTDTNKLSSIYNENMAYKFDPNYNFQNINKEVHGFSYKYSMNYFRDNHNAKIWKYIDSNIENTKDARSHYSHTRTNNIADFYKMIIHYIKFGRKYNNSADVYQTDKFINYNKLTQINKLNKLPLIYGKNAISKYITRYKDGNSYAIDVVENISKERHSFNYKYLTNRLSNNNNNNNNNNNTDDNNTKNRKYKNSNVESRKNTQAYYSHNRINNIGNFYKTIDDRIKFGRQYNLNESFVSYINKGDKLEYMLSLQYNIDGSNSISKFRDIHSSTYKSVAKYFPILSAAWQLGKQASKIKMMLNMAERNSQHKQMMQNMKNHHITGIKSNIVTLSAKNTEMLRNSNTLYSDKTMDSRHNTRNYSVDANLSYTTINSYSELDTSQTADSNYNMYQNSNMVVKKESTAENMIKTAEINQNAIKSEINTKFKYLESKIDSKVINIKKISDMVYENLRRDLKTERQRKGN